MNLLGAPASRRPGWEPKTRTRRRDASAPRNCALVQWFKARIRSVNSLPVRSGEEANCEWFWKRWWRQTKRRPPRRSEVDDGQSEIAGTHRPSVSAAPFLYQRQNHCRRMLSRIKGQVSWRSEFRLPDRHGTKASTAPRLSN